MRRARRLDNRGDCPFVALALDQQNRVGLVGDLLVGQDTQPLIVEPFVLRAVLAGQVADYG